jgi:hypothetical protein
MMNTGEQLEIRDIVASDLEALAWMFVECFSVAPWKESWTLEATGLFASAPTFRGAIASMLATRRERVSFSSVLPRTRRPKSAKAPARVCAAGGFLEFTEGISPGGYQENKHAARSFHMRKSMGLFSIFSTLALSLAACSDTSGLTQKHDAGADTKTSSGGSAGKGTGGTGGSIGGTGGSSGPKGSGGAAGGAQAGGGSTDAGGVASGGGTKSSGGSTGAGGTANRDGGGFALLDAFSLPDGFTMSDVRFQLPDGFTMPDFGFQLPDGGFSVPDLAGLNLDALAGILGDACVLTCESAAVAGADCKAGTDTLCTPASGGICVCFGAAWTCF